MLFLLCCLLSEIPLFTICGLPELCPLVLQDDKVVRFLYGVLGTSCGANWICPQEKAVNVNSPNTTFFQLLTPLQYLPSFGHSSVSLGGWFLYLFIIYSYLCEDWSGRCLLSCTRSWIFPCTFLYWESPFNIKFPTVDTSFWTYVLTN